MFKFIKKKLKRWLEEDDSIVKYPLEPRNSIRSANGTAFMIYSAHGGIVVETETYDSNIERSLRNLYVIRDDQDLGQEINQILFLEKLKQ